MYKEINKKKEIKNEIFSRVLNYPHMYRSLNLPKCINCFVLLRAHQVSKRLSDSAQGYNMHVV